MYTELLLEHFRNPRNVGELAPPAVKVDVANPACGDEMRLWAQFDNGAVVDVRYQVRGCTASIAAGSALTEWMFAKTVADLAGLKAAEIEAALGGLNPESKHAAALCVDAVRTLVRSLQSK